MQFLFPYFLAAAGVLAIPVIIHLFYFRRYKKVHFTNVKMLKEVKEESSSRRRLRNLLVLLARCAAFLFLVLAFAQPFLPSNDMSQQGSKDVSVFVDNSFSMQMLSKEASLLDLAKVRARQIVEAYANNDRFQVLTNDFEGKHQRLVSKEDALTLIDQIKATPERKPLSKVIARQKLCLDSGKSDNEIAWVLSDFQKNSTDVSAVSDTNMTVHLVPMQSVEERNISIDSVWFDSPIQILNQPVLAYIKLTNHSTSPVENLRMSLQYDNQTKPVGDASIAAGAQITDTVSFNIIKTGWHNAVFRVTDYPVQFDDEYYVSFDVARQINVLVVQEANTNRYLQRALNSMPIFKTDYQQTRAIDYSKLPDYQLIILQEAAQISTGLAQELKTFTENGGAVLVFPAPQANESSYGSLMQTFGMGNLGNLVRAPEQVATINFDEFVFRDVFLQKSANLRLPSTQAAFQIPAGRGESILTYRNGNSMLSRHRAGEGSVYLCAAPIDEQYSDLVKNGEIFVPMLFRMALSGKKVQPLAYTIGSDRVIETRHALNSNSNEAAYRMVGRRALQEGATSEAKSDPATNAEFIPEQRIIGSKLLLSPAQQTLQSGWYDLKATKDSTFATFAFNYNRAESALTKTTAEELNAQLKPNMSVISTESNTQMAGIVGEKNQGITLWRWCIVFALLFLALEVVFLRLWKV
jgi:Aerotolerance regulator N-terminal